MVPISGEIQGGHMRTCSSTEIYYDPREKLFAGVQKENFSKDVGEHSNSVECSLMSILNLMEEVIERVNTLLEEEAKSK